MVFLLMQALIFTSTVAFFVYYDIYPTYSTLEKTITKHNLTPQSQILTKEGQKELKLYKTLEKSVENFLLIFMALGIFFTIGALLFMNLLILKPIHILHEQMNWIIRNKTFRPIHQSSQASDELSDLTKHFNSLIEQVINQNETLQNLSLIDPLTQLQNRRSMDQFIDTLSGFLARAEKHLSIMMIDIDHFKLYNDSYGHIQGDEVIIKVAQAIRKHSSRSSDFVARYGGEEFAVILPDTQLENAKNIAEDIRNEVANLLLPHKASTTASFITISVGLASGLLKDKEGILNLLAAADDALYNSKLQGRNKVTDCKINTIDS